MKADPERYRQHHLKDAEKQKRRYRGQKEYLQMHAREFVLTKYKTLIDTIPEEQQRKKFIKSVIRHIFSSSKRSSKRELDAEHLKAQWMNGFRTLQKGRGSEANTLTS
jgi:hypothetical protein